MKAIYEGNLSPWAKDGDRDVKMETRHMTAYNQKFLHPITGVPYTFSQLVIGNYLVICPITTEGNLVLTYQWKQGVEQICPQFPGGKIPEGQDPNETARQKLLEEIGYQCQDIVVLPHKLHFFDSRSPNYYHVFVATGCEQVGRPNTPDAQVIGVNELLSEEFWRLVDSGNIHEPATLVAALLAKGVGHLRGY